MRKILILILLLISTQSFAQERRVMFWETAGAEVHDSEVRASFRIGYNSSGATWDTTREGRMTDANGLDTLLNDTTYKIVVRSTSGASSYEYLANKFYPYPLFFMPTDQVWSDSCSCYPSVQNYFDTLPRMVLTGAGIDSNMTAYKVEFYANDTTGCQYCPSFSNAFIAGQIMAIMDLRNCSTWEARYVARLKATNGTNPTTKNGYGKIDIGRSVAHVIDTMVYSGDPYISSDIGTLVAPTKHSEGKTFFNAYLPDINNLGLYYNIYVNDTFTVTKTFNERTFSGNIAFQIGERTDGELIKVHYEATNRMSTPKLSDPVYFRFRKYNNIITK